MSFLLISVVNRLGCESANVDNILTYKKIFVLELRRDRCLHPAYGIQGIMEQDRSGSSLDRNSLAHFHSYRAAW